MRRCVISVATGSYTIGQDRLIACLRGVDTTIAYWTNEMPPGSPLHGEVPYAFKAYAVADVASRGYDLVLWADASIVPRNLEPLWALIERQGYWFSANGFMNYDWTADSAYPLLGITKEENRQIKQIAATAFGLDLRTDLGRIFVSEYLRLAKNGSFRGPWDGGIGVQHRHDQTAASVICHRLGMKLTNPPKWFAYKGGETDETVLIVDGSYR